MMKRMILMVFLPLFAACAMAQTPNMAEVFKQMPDSLMPYIAHSDRLDMLDYQEAGMKGEVRNKVDGISVLDSLSTNYLHLTLSEALTVEMGLLPVESVTADSCMHVVCIVSTYAGMESTLTFYTAKWQSWQPQPSVNIADMLPTDDDDRYVIAAFGKSPEEILLTLSKPLLNEKKEQEDNNKYRKNIKWTGKTFK